MKRFTTDELKWQFEVGMLENILGNLLKDKEHNPRSQEKLEEFQRELNAMKAQYTGLIKEVTISSSSRIPELEEKFNLHPGHTYQVELEDKGPRDMERPRYVGTLKEITIRIDDTDFAITSITLEKGIKHSQVCTIGGGSDSFTTQFDEIRLYRKDKIRSLNLIGNQKLKGGS